MHTRSGTRVSDLTLGALFVALTAAGAFIKVPIPYVPFTLQYLFTMLAGIVLGAKKGALAVGAYVLLGLAGVPVFANGGGVGYIFQPSFGYLIGFIIGTYVTGYVCQKIEKNFFKMYFIAGIAGLAVVYLCGLFYTYLINRLYLGTEVAVWPLFLYGFILAFPGDFLLCILAASLGVRLKRGMS